MTLGKKSGPPPKRGPNPQGLNIGYKKDRNMLISEKINGKKIESKKTKNRRYIS